MSLHSKQSLYNRFSDRKFRDAFVSSRIAQTIATQARVLRQRNEMSQNDLARALGTSQNAIYRLENPKYGRPTISTLKKLASFFNVGLIVRFAPLSEIVDWTVGLSERSLNVPDFAHDTGFVARKAPQSTTDITVPIEDSIIYQQNIAQGGSRALTLLHDVASRSRWSHADQASSTQWASPALQPTERIRISGGS